MSELPLFPLNTVLFPGMQLELHIFEERYKQMINECVSNKQPFGVVLIKEGQEANGPAAEPYLVGCTAHINFVKRLEEDRMYILVVGRERFRINALNRTKPYLAGEVDLFPLRDEDTISVYRKGARLRGLVQRYLAILQKVGEVKFDQSQIPSDPKILAYLSSIILQIDNKKKQELLASETTSIILNNLLKTYRLEIALLDYMVERQQDGDNNRASLN